MTGFASVSGRTPRPSCMPDGACHFTIAVDRDRMMVRATLSGFFTVDAVERFARAEQAAVESLGCPPHHHLVLIDASKGQVHSKDVAEAFSRLVARSPLRARRIAVVSSGGLHRIQTRRILDAERSALFATLEEAERWIAEDDGGA